MAIVHLAISSSALASAVYDTDSGILDVTFTDGTSHTYVVDPETVQGLEGASSQGAFFNAYIRPLDP